MNYLIQAIHFFVDWQYTFPINFEIEIDEFAFSCKQILRFTLSRKERYELFYLSIQA